VGWMQAAAVASRRQGSPRLVDRVLAGTVVAAALRWSIRLDGPRIAVVIGQLVVVRCSPQAPAIACRLALLGV
jgi:hypothetical protein